MIDKETKAALEACAEWHKKESRRKRQVLVLSGKAVQEIETHERFANAIMIILETR